MKNNSIVNASLSPSQTLQLFKNYPANKQNNSLLVVVVLLSLFGFATVVRAELLPRANGLLVYDTEQDITWTANANIAGPMFRDDAKAWVENLVYAGYDDWRLPKQVSPDPGCTIQPSSIISRGYLCTLSELAHLFYNELGGTSTGTSGSSILDSTDPDLALFTNIQNDEYWYGSEYPFECCGWVFDFSNGLQYGDNLTSFESVWPVRDGDVLPQFSCSGPEAPFDDPISLRNRSRRAIPVVVLIADAAGMPVTVDAIAPPVVNVIYNGTVYGNSAFDDADLLPQGSATSSNLMSFNLETQKWEYVLGSGQFEAAGAYEVKVVSGDPDSYRLDSCSQSFERLE